MADTEKRDVYIAAAVGGVGLVLVLLYLWDQTPAPATNAQGEPLPSLVATPPASTPYNFNIAPFDPAPGIPYARPNINTINAPGGAGGCCDDCGPRNSAQYFNSTVSQFMTLLGYGNEGGA